MSRATSSSPSADVATTVRVVGVDVARCVALVGMIATHTLTSTHPDGSVTLVQQIAGGRASALFAVLAGVSLSMMSGRTTPVRGREARAVSAGLAARAGLVALLGLVLGELDSGVLVILTYYGVLFCLGIAFLRLRAGRLLALGAVAVVVLPVLSHLLRADLPEPSIANPTLASLADPLGLLVQLTLTGTYPAVPWLGYLLVGMGLGRLDLTKRRTAVQLVLVGTGLALLASSVSRLLLERPGVLERLDATLTGPSVGNLPYALVHGMFGTTPTGTWWWLAVDAPHSGTPLDLTRTIGSALVVTGLSLALGRLAPRVVGVLFGAGAMTLTLYSVHLVLRSPWLLREDGLRTFLSHVVIVLLVGAAYRWEGRSGPLERAVARVARSASDRVGS